MKTRRYVFTKSPVSNVSTSISQEFLNSGSESNEEVTDVDKIKKENVQFILTHRKDHNDCNEYLVKFTGRSYRNCKWVPEKEVENNNLSCLLKYKKKYEDNPPKEPYYDSAYEIPEKVISMRKNENGETEFLVKWTNLDYSYTTWETESSLGCKRLIDAYFKNNKVPSLEWQFKPMHPSPNSFKKITELKKSKAGLKMRPYQLDGLNFLVNSWFKRNNAILADEMGLGKTLQSISFLDYLYCNRGVHGPFLIVGPLSTLPHWEREIEEWTDMPVLTFNGGKTDRKFMKKYEFFFESTRYPKFAILLTTYEYIMKESDILSSIKWKCIVIDEAHRLKNHKSKLFNIMKKFTTDFKLLLSGTPLQNSIDELWTLLNFLGDSKFNNMEDFQLKFGNLNEADQIEELKNVLKPIILRRLKSDVEKTITPLEEIIIECPMTQHQKAYYKSIYTKNIDYLTRGVHQCNSINLRNIAMELRKVCNHPYLIQGAEEQILIERKEMLNIKDEVPPNFVEESLIRSAGKAILLDKLLAKLKADGHRVLIFSQMTKVLDIIQDYLNYKKYKYQRVDGSVRGDIRQEAIDAFNAPDSEDFVFLLCTKAGGLGINLTTADTVIIYDSDWNPQNDIQATARCHRIGQKKDVKVYRFITSNSYERKMFDSASLKLGLDQAILESNNKHKKAEEMEKLLRLGAYYAFEEGKDDTEKFTEEEIETILSRSLTIRHENAFGGEGSTFSKAQFEINENNQVDLAAPDFWNKYKPATVENELEASSYSIGERRRMLREKKTWEEEEDFSEEDTTSSSKEFEWTKDNLAKLQTNLFKYGLERWDIIYNNLEIDCQIQDIKLMCLSILKWLLKSSSEKYPLIEKLINQPEIKNEIKRYMHTYKELSQYVKSGSTWKLGRLNNLYFINCIITTCKNPPDDIIIPEITSQKPTEWWTYNDDKTLLYQVWKFGYLQYQPMAFSNVLDENVQSKLLASRLRSLINGLKTTYIKYKEMKETDLSLNNETIGLALSSWNKKELRSIVQALILNGYPSAKRIKEICEIDKPLDIIESYVKDIIDYCEKIEKGDKNIKPHKYFANNITLRNALKVSRRVHLFQKMQKKCDSDKFMKKDRDLMNYVLENGLQNLYSSELVTGRFGKDGLEAKVIRKLKELLHISKRSSVQIKLSEDIIPDYPKRPDGSPVLPFQITNSLILVSLGEIVQDNENYYSTRYIYPVGFETHHLYTSYDNPDEKAWYRSTIENDGDSPVFRVEMIDNPKVYGFGKTPSAPWLYIVRIIEKRKRQFGKNGNRSLTISGPEYFGLTSPLISYLIQQLSGADEIEDAQKIKLKTTNNDNCRIQRSSGKKESIQPTVMQTRNSIRNKKNNELVLDFNSLINSKEYDEKKVEVSIPMSNILQKDSLDIYIPSDNNGVESLFHKMYEKIKSE